MTNKDNEFQSHFNPDIVGSWSERFDKQFLNASAIAPTKEEVKSFIKQLLEEERTEMKWRYEQEMIEATREAREEGYVARGAVESSIKEGIRQAERQRILKLIEEIMKEKVDFGKFPNLQLPYNCLTTKCYLAI